MITMIETLFFEIRRRTDLDLTRVRQIYFEKGKADAADVPLSDEPATTNQAMYFAQEEAASLVPRTDLGRPIRGFHETIESVGIGAYREGVKSALYGRYIKKMGGKP